MGKRYGRNQKRKHKALIEELAREVVSLQWKVKSEQNNAMYARQRAQQAVDEAFQRYADNHGLIVDAVQRIAYHLGSGLPEHLKPHLERIAPHYVQDGFKMYAQDSFTSEAVELRGTIESYNYQLTVLNNLGSKIG